MSELNPALCHEGGVLLCLVPVLPLEPDPFPISHLLGPALPVPLTRGQAWFADLRRKWDANNLILMGWEFSRSITVGVWRFTRLKGP